jgi:hypothetical protein
MNLSSVALARSIWLFDINELNPSGRNIFPDAFAWLGERYIFQTFPKSTADVDAEKKGYLFKTGTFAVSDGDTITVNFSIYNDGLVAETWASTEKGDLFLDEVLRLACNRYGLVRPPNIKKQYFSEVIVKLDHPISNGVTPKVVAFCEMLNKLFTRHNLPTFEVTGIGFGLDTSRSSYKPPGLIIERKLGASFSENRFFSRSPFTTQDHLFIIEEFEKLLRE